MGGREDCHRSIWIDNLFVVVGDFCLCYLLVINNVWTCFSQIGSFFMINLCLVVIATQFSETKKREMERMRMERARYCSTSTLASTSASEAASCYRQIIKYIAHLWRRNKRRFLRRYRAYRSRKRLQRIEELKRRRAAAAAANIGLKKRPVREAADVGMVDGGDHPARRRRRRQRSKRRRRRFNPQCPKHGGGVVPSVSSQVALRLNDGRVSPPECTPLSSSSPQLPTTSNSLFLGGEQSTAAVQAHPTLQQQRSSPFLSPRGTHFIQ